MTLIGQWCAPVPSHRHVDSGWDPNRVVKVGDTVLRGHWGYDFFCPDGTAVVAVADGVVNHWWPVGDQVPAGSTFQSPYPGNGNFVSVLLDRGAGAPRTEQLCLHNTRVVVKVGDRVVKGQTIAYSGHTGFVQGPHSHVEVHENGQPIDAVRRGYFAPGELLAA